MSDQPTAGDPREDDPMADQDFSLTNRSHPTTGEWTAQRVASYLTPDYAERLACDINDSVNAALAVERERLENDEVQRLRDLAMEIVDLKKQLAAEREKAQQQLDTCFKHELELEKQLAAERTGRADDFRSLSETNLQLRQQLASDREKVKELGKGREMSDQVDT